MVVFGTESVFKTLFFYLAYILKKKKNKKKLGDRGDFCVVRALFLLFLASHKDK